jgi:D-sedoheptulose 7-phosphate isomerase
MGGLQVEPAEEIGKQLRDSIILKQSLFKLTGTLVKLAEVWVQSIKNGGKIIFMGNGGSAADAQHLAAELAGKFYLERDPLPSIALSVNTSVLTALGNDKGYENVFSLQVKALASPGDVVVGISTSGNSRNVCKAIEMARKIGAVTVAFTGAGGKLGTMADYTLAVPSTDTPRIQEAHITAGHLICYLVEKKLFGEPRLFGAVFLDRDGTIARDVPYCSRPEDFELFPGVVEAVRQLQNNGFKVVLTTNQSGIGRGYFTFDALEKIHEKLHREMARGNVRLDGIYYCPHHPDDDCECRKPRPGMLLRSSAEMNIDLEKSFMVGDTVADIEAGRRVGCRTILINTASGIVPGIGPDYTAVDFTDAVRWISSQKSAGLTGVRR